jgi:type IV pilus assembly protein PilO
MVGTYHQFGAFVSGVASLPRVVIMTMHNIVLTPRNPTPGAKIGPNSILQLAGTVKTYRYLDDNEQPGAAAPAAPAPAPAPQGGAQ